MTVMDALTARATVREWTKGAQTLAILEAVHRMGWLEQLREPTPATEFTTAQWSGNRVSGVLDVLKQAGVVTEVPGGYQLAPPFAALLTGASGVSLETVLDAVSLDLAALEKLDQEELELTGDAALIVARDAGVEADPVTQMLYRSVYDAMPEVSAVLESGGPMLDLGTGVGGALLTTAQLYPQLQLVGVDIVPEVIAEAERRRDQLGLSERVQLRCADAQTLPDQGTFRAAYWAQCFFPDASRTATLAMLRRALTTDGLLVLQEQLSGPTDTVQQGQRGISAGHTAEALTAEAEMAGFVLVRQVATNLGNLTVMRNQPE
ncbi:SAM-dependent methyltransferase [Kineosporia babensis]|uniref:Methyltransferase domain-containing protein n=1 Tax=Kineosporia babensis TaxID=499548 RepID=A0A9X1NIM4_9ACTN|nr:class I SAM-dependent methyltransferase [Kineosporia babensis]MCD5314760.1 methyltransferase domain-containing protein [Kineosporia babensis]